MHDDDVALASALVSAETTVAASKTTTEKVFIAFSLGGRDEVGSEGGRRPSLLNKKPRERRGDEAAREEDWDN